MGWVDGWMGGWVSEVRRPALLVWEVVWAGGQGVVPWWASSNRKGVVVCAVPCATRQAAPTRPSPSART